MKNTRKNLDIMKEKMNKAFISITRLIQANKDLILRDHPFSMLKVFCAFFVYL